MGLFAWLRREREWRRTHIAAFKKVTEIGADGLTEFQHLACEALADLVPRDSYRRETMKHAPGYFLVAPLRDTGISVWIYADDAGLFGAKTSVPFEEWDYLTPKDLIEALVNEARRRAA